MKALEIAQLFQSAITSIAIISGGAWAVYIYVNSTSTSAIVGTEVQKARCLAQTALDINIIDNSKLYPGAKGFVIGIVDIKNVGSAPVNLHFDNPPIRVSKIDFTNDGKVTQQTIHDAIDIELYRAPSVISITNGASPATQPVSDISVLPGKSIREPFLLKVPSAAFYMIDFWGGERKLWNGDKNCTIFQRDETKGYAWEATTIVHVD